jgi:hypothetical protein
MNVSNLEILFEQAKKLSADERLRLVEMLSVTLQRDRVSPADWHTALRETFGLLSDDPIERPPQLPLEQRDPIV